MKLLRLILQGFKSFADKTTIEFADGMTVIVGPNGCGKSNISDAVRWVLGEQNVHNLRGQKTEDIIFSGAEGRNPKNAAEVTMVLDNSAHEFSFDTAEVSITRRVLRNGESDFYINKRSCRLKDIQELLADTGLGKGSMAIIGQNRVDQVLTSRPEDRRLIFEEVAGISLFRMRKNEGLRKLEKTAENMERVRDLVALLDEQLGPMKEAAEKSKIYKALSKDRRAVEATMSLLRLTSVGRMIARYENEYNSLADQDVKWQTELARYAEAKAKIEKEELEQQENLRKAGADSAEKQRLMETLRGDYRVKEEALRHAEEESVRLKEDEEDQTEAENELKEEMREMLAELAEAESLLLEKQTLLKAEEEKRRIAESELLAAETAYQDALAVNRRRLAERESLEREIEQGNREKVRLTEEKEKFKAAGLELSEKRKMTEIQVENLTAEEASLREKMTVLEENGKNDGIRLKEAQDKQFRQMNRINDFHARLMKIISRREYLERADREYASFSHTTKTILESRSLFGQHILGAVGELIRVPPKYTAAAEVALGSSVSYIVTDTSCSAGDVITWLKKNNLGRTTFYPLESMRPRENDGNERKACSEKGIHGIASELFFCDEEYGSLIDSILGKTLIAENLDVARTVSAKYNYRLRLVTLDGQLVNPGGSLTGGSMRKQENTFFGRKKEINDLLKEEKETEKLLADLKKEKSIHDDFCAELSEKVTKEREDYQSLKIGLAEISGKKDGLSRILSTEKNAEEKNQADLRTAEEGLAAITENLALLEERLAGFGDIPVMETDEKSASLKKAVADLDARLMEIRIDVTKAEEAVNFGKRGKQERENAALEQRKDRKKLSRDILENREQKERLASELRDIEEKFNLAEKEWNEVKGRLENMQNISDTFSAERKQQDDAWRNAQEKSSAVRKDMADRQARIDSFKAQEAEEKERLREQELTVEMAESMRIQGSMAEMKEKQADLEERISKLGAVNPNGEEEYELHLRRRAFYETQIEDLKKAKSGLETVIHDIDKTMSERFADAFKMINVEFARIMQIMFSGGKARLELTDEAHPLEGGVEMYLQLPGKKRQPLTLMSGGERALTVIALLISFMAYRPAPFCFVDEIDAALDDANVERYSRMIADYKRKTQFVIISHRKKTMEFADTLQGVTMAEKGVSSLVTVRVGDYIKEEQDGVS